MPEAKTLNVTKKSVDFATIFNDVEEVYFHEGEELTSSKIAAGVDVIELPVVGDGVTFNTGDPSVTQIKLTTEKIWTSKATKGDSDISFNVPSLDGEINSLFMHKKDLETLADGFTLNGTSYKANAFNLSPKKVTGALILPSNDKAMTVILVKVEMYASLVLADNNNPAYFSVKVTPLESSEGVEVIIAEKSAV